jgi:hypothetical protein
MTKMKSILILSFTDLSKDPRPYKQIKLLNDKYKITSVGKKPSGFENQFIQYEKESLIREIFRLILLVIKNYHKYYWSKSKIGVKNKLKNEVFDLIIAHDEKTLPLAQEISNGAKIILDAHEYHLEEHDGSVIGKCLNGYVKYLHKNLIKTPDAMITVCNGIAEKYLKDFDLKSKVIMNVPNYMKLHPARIQNDKIRLIHHGLATSIRKIENMIKMMDYLDDSYHLDLMLVSNRSDYFYMQKLKRLVNKKKNVSIIPPISFGNIIPTLNKYDIGLDLLPATKNSSLKYGLPNKFFEFIQARLAIAIGPSPEMAKIVKEYDLGIISDDFTPQNLAEKILSLSNDKIMYFKNQSNLIADKLSFNNEGLKILDIINNLI